MTLWKKEDTEEKWKAFSAFIEFPCLPFFFFFWRETKRWMEEGSKKIDKFPSSTLPPFWRGKGESTSPTFAAMKRGGGEKSHGTSPVQEG